MHGLPKHLDLTFFRGQVLVQICFGLHDLRLNFDKGGAIHTERCVHLLVNGVPDFVECQSMIEAASLLSRLLDERVTEARVAAPKTLELSFSNGDRLRFIDSNEHYESFRIESYDKSVAVV